MMVARAGYVFRLSMCPAKPLTVNNSGVGRQGPAPFPFLPEVEETPR